MARDAQRRAARAAALDGRGRRRRALEQADDELARIGSLAKLGVRAGIPVTRIESLADVSRSILYKLLREGRVSAKLEPTRYPDVFRRGARYLVRYRDGRGAQRQQAGFLRAKDADNWKKDREREIGDGVWLGEGRKPFDSYVLDWVDQGRGRLGFRESTRHDYRRVPEHARTAPKP